MGGKTLTRADLAEAVVQKIGLPRNKSAGSGRACIAGDFESLARGRPSSCPPSAPSASARRAKRVGRNPKTGQEVPITPRRVLVFRPSNIMKERINTGLIRRAAE